MLGAISITSGSRTLDEYIHDMKVREQTPERITEVTAALKPYYDKLMAGTIKPVVGTNDPTLKPSEKFDEDIFQIREMTNDRIKFEYSVELLDLGTSFRKIKEVLKNEVPQDLLCPITQEIFVDPVISVGDQRTYERLALVIWNETFDVSPVTKEKMETKEYINNIAIKNMINSFFEKNKHKLE